MAMSKKDEAQWIVQEAGKHNTRGEIQWRIDSETRTVILFKETEWDTAMHEELIKVLEAKMTALVGV